MALNIIVCVMTEEFLEVFFYCKGLSKEVAAMKFAQRVCGFDLIRVIDVNGWIFVRDNGL